MSRKNTIELPAARYDELSRRNLAARTKKPLKRDLPKAGIPAHVPAVPERATVPMRNPSKPLKPIPTEHNEQVAVIDWWRIYAATHKIPEYLLFAIPNGANKSMASAAKFKREGLRKGIPDLCLAVARGKYHGLYMEMKRLVGSHPSPEQRDMANLLRAQHYEVFFCYGATHAIRVIIDYLALKA